MTKYTKVAIGADWAAVRNNPLITQVRQLNRASLGGYLLVDKSATHLPNSGIKKDGVNQMTPINSFMVKDFKDGILCLSGQCAITAKRVQENTNQKVSLSILFTGCSLYFYTILF